MKASKNKMNKGLIFALCIFGTVTVATLCSCSKTVEEMYKNDQINQPSSGVILVPIIQHILLPRKEFMDELDKIGHACGSINKARSLVIPQVEMIEAQACAVKSSVATFFELGSFVVDVINFLTLTKSCPGLLCEGYGYSIVHKLNILAALQRDRAGNNYFNNNYLSALLTELKETAVIFTEIANGSEGNNIAINVHNRCAELLSTSAQIAQVVPIPFREYSSTLTDLHNGCEKGPSTSAQTAQVGRTLDDAVDIPAEAWEEVKDKLIAMGEVTEAYKRNLLRAALHDWKRKLGQKSQWKQLTLKYGILDSRAASNRVYGWQHNGHWNIILDCLEKYSELSWIKTKRSCMVQEEEKMGFIPGKEYITKEIFREIVQKNLLPLRTTVRLSSSYGYHEKKDYSPEETRALLNQALGKLDPTSLCRGLAWAKIAQLYNVEHMDKLRKRHKCWIAYDCWKNILAYLQANGFSWITEAHIASLRPQSIRR